MKKNYFRGKHLANKKLNKKYVISFIALFIVFTSCVISMLKNNKNQSTYSQEQNIIPNINEVDIKTYTKIEMPDTIGNFDIIGQLVIDKINVNKYILNKTNDDSLNLSVTKFYGPKANKEGNLCIIGHNYRNLFINLRQLNVDDTFYIIDKENGEKVTYKIYDKYKVRPTNLDCLNQNTENKREVTLITCNPRRVN